MSKTTLLLGAGIGYVLGTRAGRQRYEQIKSAASAAWGNPRVQQTVSSAQRTAMQGAKSATTSLKEAAVGSSATNGATPLTTSTTGTTGTTIPPTL